MKLSDAKIRNTKPTDRSLKLFDGRGMFLLVSPGGQRGWRLKYRFGGKEKLLSLGTYPEIGLKEARERCDEARRLLANNVDPSQQRKAQKASGLLQAADSFEAIAREWHEQRRGSLGLGTLAGIMMRMEKHLFPWMGSRPVAQISAQEVLAVLRKAEAQELGETPRRLRQYCSQIFRYAIYTGRREGNPAADLGGALRPHKAKHHAAVVDPKAVGELMRAIDGYTGEPVTRAALRLAPLLFVRPGELRGAAWEEFDLDNMEWRIPAARMKMRDSHLVPLSRQAVEILREVHHLTGRWHYVFPSIRSKARCMSENTLAAALRRLGYSSEVMTVHGFRTVASTLLNEQGWSRDAIERQLAHAERDGVRAAYNRAEYLKERRTMMQAWADHLDRLKLPAGVRPLFRPTGYGEAPARRVCSQSQ